MNLPENQKPPASFLWWQKNLRPEKRDEGWPSLYHPLLHTSICVSDYGETPAKLTRSLSAVRLQRDVQNQPTRTGLTPSPARSGFPLKPTVSINVFLYSFVLIIILYRGENVKYIFHKMLFISTAFHFSGWCPESHRYCFGVMWLYSLYCRVNAAGLGNPHK